MNSQKTHHFTFEDKTRNQRNRPFQQKYVDDYRFSKRPINDTGAYFQRLEEANGPGDYMLNKNYVSMCDTSPPFGYSVKDTGMFPRTIKRSQKMESLQDMNSLKMLDADLEMRSKTRKGYGNVTNSVLSLSNCRICGNCDEGLPCKCKHCEKKMHGANSMDVCRPGVISKNSLDTRNFNGCSDLNGIFINRFDFLCQNPQDPNRILFYNSNRRLGEETRLDMRDNYPSGMKGIDGYKKGQEF